MNGVGIELGTQNACPVTLPQGHKFAGTITTMGCIVAKKRSKNRYDVTTSYETSVQKRWQERSVEHNSLK